MLRNPRCLFQKSQIPRQPQVNVQKAVVHGLQLRRDLPSVLNGPAVPAARHALQPASTPSVLQKLIISFPAHRVKQSSQGKPVHRQIAHRLQDIPQMMGVRGP